MILMQKAFNMKLIDIWYFSIYQKFLVEIFFNSVDIKYNFFCTYKFGFCKQAKLENVMHDVCLRAMFF